MQHDVRASSGAAAGDEAGTAEAVGGERAHGDGATYLHQVDDHREEVDPPSDGASTRLGLEPRSVSSARQLGCLLSGSTT